MGHLRLTLIYYGRNTFFVFVKFDLDLLSKCRVKALQNAQKYL
jgi:hypothetical protein